MPTSRHFERGQMDRLISWSSASLFVFADRTVRPGGLAERMSQLLASHDDLSTCATHVLAAAEKAKAAKSEPSHKSE